MKYRVNLVYEDGKKMNTWGVIPVLSNTKILNGVYNPEEKVLRLYLDSLSQDYQQIPVQNGKGKVELQMRKMDKYYHISLDTPEDIKFFLDTYVENNFEIDPTTVSKLIKGE